MLPPRIQRDFWRFHYANPHVYRLLSFFAQQWIQTGRRKCSIRLLGERVRWELGISTNSDDEFLLNDHTLAYYSRLWMMEHPELPEFFNIRAIRGGTFLFRDQNEVASWPDEDTPPWHWNGDTQGSLF